MARQADLERGGESVEVNPVVALRAEGGEPQLLKETTEPRVGLGPPGDRVELFKGAHGVGGRGLEEQHPLPPARRKRRGGQAAEVIAQHREVIAAFMARAPRPQDCDDRGRVHAPCPVIELQSRIRRCLNGTSSSRPATKPPRCATNATPPPPPPPPSAQESELRQEPEAEEDEGRDLHRLGEETEPEQGHDPGVRVEEEVGAEHPGDRAARADHRHVRGRVGGDVRSGGRRAADQVEGEKARVAGRVLDVVAEDPEKDHVAEQVQHPAVQEHRGRDRQAGREHRRGVRRRPGELGRHRAEDRDEGRAVLETEPELVEEDQDVRADERDRHPREGPGRDGVSQRYHEGSGGWTSATSSAPGAGASTSTLRPSSRRRPSANRRIACG